VTHRKVEQIFVLTTIKYQVVLKYLFYVHKWTLKCKNSDLPLQVSVLCTQMNFEMQEFWLAIASIFRNEIWMLKIMMSPQIVLVNMFPSSETYKVHQKIMRLIFYLPKFYFFSNINVISLGSYTPMEMLFPRLVAALEWNVSDLAYNRHETRDMWSLVRDPDRSWCHIHTSVKLFWSHPMIP
jgi:hypothetical protein